jgi:hypothetical protein
MSQGFDELLEQSIPQMRELALEARKLITDVHPNVVEAPWPLQKMVGYAVNSQEVLEYFCWMGFGKDHIALGFYYGTQLPDPTHLLKGTSRLVRHVTLRSVTELRNPALRDLIRAATTHRTPSASSQKQK